MKFVHLKGTVTEATGVSTANVSSDSRGNVSTSSSRHYEVRVQTEKGVRDYNVFTKCSVGDELIILWANGYQVADANLTSGGYHWRGPPSSWTRRLILLAIAIVGFFFFFIPAFAALGYYFFTKNQRSNAVKAEIKRLADFV
jgi:hypothetical protein